MKAFTYYNLMRIELGIWQRRKHREIYFLMERPVVIKNAVWISSGVTILP
jgi:acetyltransferase-like isoleucine patch superfamily enzyme